MAEGQAWLETSLRRSASLGLEVLERASRRSVDWTSTASQTTTPDADAQTHVKTGLNDALATMAEFMAQTTCQCKRFYESDCCTEPTDDERNHVSRFHSRQTPALPTQKPRFSEVGCCTTPSDDERSHVAMYYTRPTAEETTPARPTRKYGRVLGKGEDFYFEVSPGTYAIAARMTESPEQTRLVSVRAGQTIKITFDL